MSQEKVPARRKLESVERQEEKTWVDFYPQARSDAALAEEILAELERDETLRRRHRGLYLCCQRCIRLHENREARNRRIGRFVRSLFSALFIAFPKAALAALRSGRNLAVACLPEAEENPAERQVRRLIENEAYAQADKAFRERARKAADRSDATAPAPAANAEAAVEPRSATQSAAG
ncbi:hypothetical protein DelCs14_1722 [Delftia sp. Cs1-4]|uniref:hypothetical protein n=1 Tax=Delftia sp. (strain Cs1-4) TaxID=742013 RepID=UPI00020E7AE1|nr:hypothetical protein [Delftia sp. Cs1-4]AEF88751.1 hypothetical protein DelCs14_1722 [Delftia sp. Cs1-4]